MSKRRGLNSRRQQHAQGKLAVGWLGLFLSRCDAPRALFLPLRASGRPRSELHLPRGAKRETAFHGLLSLFPLGQPIFDLPLVFIARCFPLGQRLPATFSFLEAILTALHLHASKVPTRRIALRLSIVIKRRIQSPRWQCRLDACCDRFGK
jgi:hypothetical protein